MSGDNSIFTLNLPLIAVTSPSTALNLFIYYSSFFWTLETQQGWIRMGENLEVDYPRNLDSVVLWPSLYHISFSTFLV
jgi:hypothetical protein